MKTTDITRFVFFDHGGTLAYLRKDSPQIVLEVLAESGYDFPLERVKYAVEEMELYWQTKYQALPRGSRFNSRVIEDCYRYMLRNLGIGQGASRLARRIDSEWHDRAEITLYPDTIPCLEVLKQLDLPIGIITQTLWTEEEFRRLHLRREGIERYFSLVITTESIGYDKPDTLLYAKSASLVGCAPSEVMHVGDSYELDVRGARSAGMRAVLIVRNRKPASYDCKIIESLLQLPQLID